MKKLCVITGSRAEYGLLRPLIDKIKKDKDVELQLIVTGMHLEHHFGLTYREIELDGYKIDRKIAIDLNGDTSEAICKSMGLAMIGFGETYASLRPDMVIVLGDRYEIFAAVSAAMISQIPIAHIHGGEITQGAYDDWMRHAISKMSYLHFTSTEVYRQRVIQLGESPNRVYHVGALGVENIKQIKLLSQKALEAELQFSLGDCSALVTFHPVTLESHTASTQFENLLEALEALKNLKIIFTQSNADTGGRIINQMIQRYVLNHPEKAAAFTSLGSLKYLSLMKYSTVVIGNSSSGIIEAPALKIPSVNIGDRQKGRIKADSVIDSGTSVKEISEAIQRAFNYNRQEAVNPYEKEKTSEQIVASIKQALHTGIDLKKSFYDFRERISNE
ncbi:MAG: neuC [Clostridia bacterium]|nr:neuC [Clostridia bacterium]